MEVGAGLGSGAGLGLGVGEEEEVGPVFAAACRLLGEVVGPAEALEQGADEVLLGLGFVGVGVGGEVVEAAAGFLMKRGEGGALGLAFGGLADAVGEEVLGEEVAGHGGGWIWVWGSIACLGLAGGLVRPAHHERGGLGAVWEAWVLWLCGSTRAAEDSGPAHHERGPGTGSEAWVLWAVWFDTGRRGRRPGSPRTGGWGWVSRGRGRSETGPYESGDGGGGE